MEKMRADLHKETEATTDALLKSVMGVERELLRAEFIAFLNRRMESVRAENFFHLQRLMQSFTLHFTTKLAGEALRTAGGGEGGELEPDGSSTVAAVEQPEHPWAPKDTDEMLQEIADAGYGVSGDRSSALAPRLIKAYNSKADIYEQVVQKQGQPLREGFSVVKVRAARA